MIQWLTNDCCSFVFLPGFVMAFFWFVAGLPDGPFVDNSGRMRKNRGVVRMTEPEMEPLLATEEGVINTSRKTTTSVS
jgi:hypothetical protein